MTAETKKILDSALSSILKNYKNEDVPMRATHTAMPNQAEMVDIISNLHRVLFPGFFDEGEGKILKSEDAVDQLLYET